MPKGYKIGGLRRWVVEDLQSSLYDLTETNSIIDNEDTKNPFDYTVG
ncbi:hypothetical protein [Roseibium aggregatum]|nr:hypothetical protein [Roseibium aggregatum]